MRLLAPTLLRSIVQRDKSTHPTHYPHAHSTRTPKVIGARCWKRLAAPGDGGPFVTVAMASTQVARAISSCLSKLSMSAQLTRASGHIGVATSIGAGQMEHRANPSLERACSVGVRLIKLTWGITSIDTPKRDTDAPESNIAVSSSFLHPRGGQAEDIEIGSCCLNVGQLRQKFATHWPSPCQTWRNSRNSWSRSTPNQGRIRPNSNSAQSWRRSADFGRFRPARAEFGRI